MMMLTRLVTHSTDLIRAKNEVRTQEKRQRGEVPPLSFWVHKMNIRTYPARNSVALSPKKKRPSCEYEPGNKEKESRALDLLLTDREVPVHVPVDLSTCMYMDGDLRVA